MFALPTGDSRRLGVWCLREDVRARVAAFGAFAAVHLQRAHSFPLRLSSGVPATVSPSTPPKRIYFDRELTAEPRRHTDGMRPRDSEPAVASRYPRHSNVLADVAAMNRKGVPYRPGARALSGSNYPRSPEFHAVDVVDAIAP